MKNTKRVLCLVVCGLLLAAVSASALTQEKPWFHHSQGSAKSKASSASGNGIWTDPKYEAVLLENSLSYPQGIGVGVLGDRVLVGTIGDYSLWGRVEGSLTFFDYFYEPSGGKMCAGTFYAGNYYGDLYRLNADRSLEGVLGWDDPYYEISAIAMDPVTQDIYFMRNDWIDYPYDVYTDLFRYRPSNGKLTYINGWEGFISWGIAVRGNSVYIADVYDDVIWRMAKNGGGLHLFVDGLYEPADIEFDAKGNLYIAEFAGGSIAMVKTGTTTVKRIATGFYTPNYIGLDKLGDIFFSDYYGSTLWELKKK